MSTRPAFPCNQFGKQEPKTHGEILDFVADFGVEFPVFAKVWRPPSHSLLLLAGTLSHWCCCHTESLVLLSHSLPGVAVTGVAVMLTDSLVMLLPQLFVNGGFMSDDGVDPLYQYLKKAAPGFGSDAIKWNFTKVRCGTCGASDSW